MKAELKIQWRRCLEFSFTVLQLVLIVASISFAAPLIGNANYFCNATGGDCHEEPPCVDSDPCPSPPIGSQLRYITYHSLGKQPICNSKIYGSCLRPEGSNKTERCSYYTRCRLHSQGSMIPRKGRCHVRRRGFLTCVIALRIKFPFINFVLDTLQRKKKNALQMIFSLFLSSSSFFF